MHRFRFRNHQLYCEDISVQEIAEKTDTPFYLYSQNTILDNYDRMETAFEGIEHLICFAVKANSNVKLLALLARKGAGADIVSGGELSLALDAGFPPKRIVFAGVGKRDDEIKYGFEKEILAFHVESFEELVVINEIAKSQKRIATVALRLNPNIAIDGHPYISTGKAIDKFGIDLPTAKRIFRQLSDFENVALIGLHCHIGSQVNAVEPYLQAVRFLRHVLSETEENGLTIEYIDIGGGLAVRHKDVLENPPIVDENKNPDISIEGLVGELESDLKDLGCKILFEPGRALIAAAGILVTKVLYRKELQGKQFVVVDAAMNDFIRPSLYGGYHEIVPICDTQAEMTTVDVVGPICESGDFFARDRFLPEVSRGDLLAIMTTGAYGFTLSSNYNARPRPAEILVDHKAHMIIRNRERLEELWT